MASPIAAVKSTKLNPDTFYPMLRKMQQRKDLSFNHNSSLLVRGSNTNSHYRALVHFLFNWGCLFIQPLWAGWKYGFA